MRVKEVMKKVLVSEDVKLREAAEIMAEKNIGSLVIVKGDKILGIVTERDVVNNVKKLDKKISEIMKKSVVTIPSGTTLDSAAEIMAKSKIRRLPVVDNGKLMGIITATDIIINSNNLNENFFFD